MSTVKGEEKNSCKKDKHAMIEQKRVSLGLSDLQRTPMPGETLGNFYRRTRMYWQMTAQKHTQHTGNELQTTGFDLAKARYKELKPILDEAILVADQNAEEKATAETSSRNEVNHVEASSRRKAGMVKSSRRKVNLLETSSRKKLAQTSSREEVNPAETSSQKKAGAGKSYRKKVNPAGNKL